ncbi:MAG: hypothetical protein FJX25_01940 [Alphaproteobacteria bacterium]|nr:hypothetical protein [Alphaproteobacteria bacterium]
MTKLMSGAALALVLVLPVHAQDAQTNGTPAGEAAAEVGADAATRAPDVAPQTEEDDDEEEAGDEGGVHDAAGKFDYGFAGLLARDNRTDLAPLTLASGQPVAAREYTLKSGGYYRIEINADGSQELALSGGDFFRAIWINEIVIEDIEIRPMGVHSIEFDSAGTARLSFVAVLPGRYTLSVPGSSGDSLQAVFNIQ